MKVEINIESQTYATKGIILGVFIAIICNCLYLTTSILVKEYELLAAEICFIRGLIQISAFLIVNIIIKIYQNYHHSKKDVKKENVFYDAEKGVDWTLGFIVGLCGLSFGMMTMLAYIGVKMIPLSDFVVFGHTAPVFSLILSAIILR